MIDILIQNGNILDGSGSPAFQADIAVTDGRITAIGSLSKAEAHQYINARDNFVTPGFIDVHSHSDTYILLAPDAESKITQGITTEVVGNCGASAAPLTGQARMPSDWASMPYPKKWKTVAEYRSALEEARPAVNIKLLTGHNTLRGGVLGYEKTEASPGTLREMIQNLEQAMDEGSSGLSTGLLYPPGMFASENEVVELCRVVAARGGIYTTHMRSEGAHLIDAIEETIRIGRQSGVRTQISHLKTSGKNNWHLLEKALELIHAAQKSGLDIAADRYPYTSACTDLDVLLPDYAQSGSRADILERLQNPSVRKRIIHDLRNSRTEDYWSTVTVGSVTADSVARFQGAPLPSVAEDLNVHPAEAVIILITEDLLRTSAFFAGMSEDNMLRILSEPYVMTGTDASLRTTSGILSRDFPHPRAFGSFPRFLRLVIDKRFITLPEAVRKITALPAQQFHISGRGMVKPGNIADLTIFSPDTVTDKATYSDPHKLSQGIDCVIVNGSVALDAGRQAEPRKGQFIA